MRTRVAFGVAVPFAMMECAVEAVPSTPVNLFDEAAATVVTRRLTFDTLWVHGGPSDTIMLNADRVAAFPDGDAAVLDLLGRRVHRMGAEGVVWSWGTRGDGPGEIDHVRDLDVNAQGEVVLADSGNGRLQWLSGDGQWLREAGLPDGTINVDAIASLEGGDYILSSLMHASALAALESAPTGPAANRWVRVSAPYPYVRHSGFPEVETGGLTGGRTGFRVGYRDRPGRVARDVAMRSDTVYVLAGNNWELDRYESTTGQYLGSMLLPVPLSQLALTPEGFIGIVAGGMYPQVIALQAR